MTRRTFLASVAAGLAVTQVSSAAVKPRSVTYRFAPVGPLDDCGPKARRMFEEAGFRIRDVKSVETNWENGVRWVRFEV